MVASAKNNRNPLPKVILEAPQLFSGLEIYFQAFFDLDTERSHGMGLTPIPWSAILRYARYQELDEEQTEDLLHYVRAMDNFNLNRLSAEAQRKNK